MKTILVDYEQSALLELEDKARTFSYITISERFMDSWMALQYVREHEVDLAILCADMPEMNGIELGSLMRQVNPSILLIYVSREETFVAEAFRLHAAAYLLKPYDVSEIHYAMESAFLLSKRKPKRIYARTFGYFNLFLDGKPIMFKSAKVKELLALLVDRQGGVVDSEQIIATLWNDRPNDEATQSLCSKLCKALLNELKAYGIEELLISSRSNRSINLDMLSCDLYDMLDGNTDAGKLYYGEYMIDYDWAEYRNYSLSKFI